MQYLQDTKDTFYLMLRDRIAALNPARTVVVRGTLRPGVIALENELPAASVQTGSPPDTFCLLWTGLALDPQSASSPGQMALARAACAIHYGTDGTAGNAGLDRGRLLTAMDAELYAALGPVQPQSAAKLSAGNGMAVTADGTNVFWSDVEFGPLVMNGERVGRTATLEVFGYGQ